MQNRFFTLILVVVVGVLMGVGIVAKQAKDPLLREILEKQDTILEIQKGSSSAGINTLGDANISAILQNQKNLETRLASLESQIKALQGTVQQARGGGGNVRKGPPSDEYTKVHDIDIAHSKIKGKKDAPITIVEFIDFQCPFCAKFHPPINEVLSAYPDKVNYVVKNFPLSFHPEARPAAKAALAAGEQGKYWEMVDALLENGRGLSRDKYQELAKNLGLNVDQFLKDYKNKDAQWEDYIRKDMSLASKVDVRGTPTFFINGKKTTARDFNSFKREIDQILSKQK